MYNLRCSVKHTAYNIEHAQFSYSNIEGRRGDHCRKDATKEGPKYHKRNSSSFLHHIAR